MAFLHEYFELYRFIPPPSCVEFRVVWPNRDWLTSSKWVNFFFSFFLTPPPESGLQRHAVLQPFQPENMGKSSPSKYSVAQNASHWGNYGAWSFAKDSGGRPTRLPRVVAPFRLLGPPECD